TQTDKSANRRLWSATRSSIDRTANGVVSVVVPSQGLLFVAALAYSTRPWPTSAVTRLGAPHLLHFTSSRVFPRVMVTFRAIASLTKRSDSWRMASLDIVGTRGLRIVSSITQQFQVAKPETLSIYRGRIAGGLNSPSRPRPRGPAGRITPVACQ